LRLATIAGIARLVGRLAWAGLRHRPRPQTIAQRLAALPRLELPLAAPVEIRWSDRLVPFIEARSDRDLAVALGLVHAHLRLAQMELLRRIAQGRLSEILGPVAVGFDHGLRLLDPARAVPLIEQALPPPTGLSPASTIISPAPPNRRSNFACSASRPSPGPSPTCSASPGSPPPMSIGCCG
jgi:penicillin amidase